ncbi:MAG: redoxin domain-containing protein, partial [Myxococcota bacterium]
MLAVGDRVDEFTLLDQNGNEVKWADFRGKPVVVFFYPRANTPGCTKEACA